MHIKISPEKANRISAELLSLSRSLRQSRAGVENVQHQLRQLTELNECKAALRRQEDSIAELTARLVNMSTALQEIADTYQNTEEQIQNVLEERTRFHHEPGKVIIYGVTDTLHKQIQQILYK